MIVLQLNSQRNKGIKNFGLISHLINLHNIRPGATGERSRV